MNAREMGNPLVRPFLRIPFLFIVWINTKLSKLRQLFLTGKGKPEFSGRARLPPSRVFQTASLHATGEIGRDARLRPAPPLVGTPERCHLTCLRSPSPDFVVTLTTF